MTRAPAPNAGSPKQIPIRRYTDWLALKQLYGVERLRLEVTRLRSLDPRTLAFCSVYFDLPKESFRCYSKTPSLGPELVMLRERKWGSVKKEVARAVPTLG